MIYFKVNKIYNLEILVPGVNIKWEKIKIKWNKNKNKKTMETPEQSINMDYPRKV